MTALDAAKVQRVSGRPRSAGTGFSGKVGPAQADATALDPLPIFGIAKFERIFFSYTLSMIPDWRSALSRAMALLAPVGELHSVDFGQCEQLPASLRLCLANHDAPQACVMKPAGAGIQI